MTSITKQQAMQALDSLFAESSEHCSETSHKFIYGYFEVVEAYIEQLEDELRKAGTYINLAKAIVQCKEMPK